MAAAVDEALSLAEEAARSGAEILFLPEYCGGLRSEGPRLTPPADGEGTHVALAAFREFAARARVWMNIGSIAVNGPGGKILNRGYMLDPSGAVTGRYDKIHLFDVTLSENAVYRESDTVAPGVRARLHRAPTAVIGHTICYDLRFPGLFRELAKAGAEIIACPAAFTKTTGEAHWHVLNRARAIENTRFVVSACATGAVPGGGECHGHSLIVDPWGRILADGGVAPGVVRARLDLDEAPRSAARVPSLSHDRAFTVDAGEEERSAA